jgi:hypothetical protein
LTNEDNLATNKKIIAKRYRIEKKLGSGNYGTAFLVNDLKNDELLDSLYFSLVIKKR